MNQATDKKLSTVQRGAILLKIQNGESVDSILSKMSAEEHKELRDFLETELLYLSELRDEKRLNLSQIKSNYEPAPNYYYKQDCHEPLESCLNETCLNANPDCFSRKMRTHIDVLIKLLTPFLEKQ
ncbi:hypothetical protein B1H10_04425 [candidate division KSB1 bacterium 4484_188]|nr:MAG: hypothetical protein B1H10_04425 [candidate division KSB1 bacterium 4484_188]